MALQRQNTRSGNGLATYIGTSAARGSQIRTLISLDAQSFAFMTFALATLAIRKPGQICRNERLPLLHPSQHQLSRKCPCTVAKRFCRTGQYEGGDRGWLNMHQWYHRNGLRNGGVAHMRETAKR